MAGGRRNLSPMLGGLAIAAAVIAHPAVFTRTLAAGRSLSSPKVHVALLVAAVGMLGLGLLLLWKRPRVTWPDALLLAGSLLMSLALGEATLRVLYHPTAQAVGWRTTAAAGESNELGLRGHPIRYGPDDTVVVLLGDSHVEAKACAWELMPERRLEHHLRAHGRPARVVSVAASGWGQDQQLLALREYYGRHRADLVVLWETPGNDVWNNMFPTHWGWLKPTFRLEDGRLVEPAENIGDRVPLPRTRLGALWERFVRRDRDAEWERRLPPPYRPLVGYEGPVNMAWQRRWERGLRSQNVPAEKTDLAMGWVPRSARMDHGLRLTRALLQEIKTLVASHGGRFLVFYHELDARLETEPRSPDVYVLDGKHYRSTRQQWQQNVAFMNEELPSLVIKVTTDDWRVGPTDPHLNEQATDQVMRDLAVTLRDL